MTTEQLQSSIRVIEDYPIKGIHFQDVTTLLKDPACIKETVKRITDLYADKGITKVVGLESRGFILGGALAVALDAGFVPARKKGKLPAEKIQETYTLEYGTDTIEMHTGAIEPGDVVLIHDDLIATGGSLAAAYRLVQKFSPAKVYFNVIIDLNNCPRIPEFPAEVPMTCVLSVSE